MEKTGIRLIDTFVYSGKEFLDKRVFCENISELKATDSTSIPEGFMRYVKSEQKWYKYDPDSPSSRTTGHWHGIDGFDNMDDSEFVYAIVDNTGNLVWGIRKDGTVYQQGVELNGPITAKGAIVAGGGITADGDLVANGSAEFNGPIKAEESLTLSDTKISEMYNDEFIYAIIDYTGHVLFGIKRDGSIYVPKGIPEETKARFEELSGIQVNTSEEFPFAIVDLLNNLLFGINNEGEVYIPKGQPEETKARFDELKLIQVNESTEFPFAIVDAKNSIVFAIKYTGEVYIPRGLPEEVRVRFEELEPIKPNVSEEFPFAVVDPTDFLVFGVNREGEMYAAKGQPEETKARFKELEAIQPNNSDAMPFAIVTDKGGVTLGVTNEGEVYIGKGQPEETKARFADLEPIQALDAESEYNYTIVDTNNNLLFGVKKDGKVVIPGGIEDGSLEGAEGFQIMHNEQYVFAITDKDGKVLFGIDTKGHSFVNGVNGVASVEQFDNKDFVYAIMDSHENLLFGIKKDGSTYIKSLDYNPDSVVSYLQPMEDHEFIYTILDDKGKILFGIYTDGSTYIPKGLSKDTTDKLNKLTKQVNQLQEDLEYLSEHGADWSEQTYLELPIPRVCAKVEITGTVPTSKWVQVAGTLTYRDVDGNSFTKPIRWSTQGNISGSFDKKNYSIDLLNSPDPDDSFDVKFGDWVAQDGFHLKAYYSDFWKIRSLVPYRHAEQIAQTRPYYGRYPFDKYKVLATNQTVADTIAGHIYNSKGKEERTGFRDDFEDVQYDIHTGALCHPDGFPVMLTINGKEYGLYTWNLKKNKDNYMIKKNDDKGEQIFFGDYTYSTFQRYNNTYWSISNYNLSEAQAASYNRWSPTAVYNVGDRCWDEETFDYEVNGQTSSVTIRRLFQCVTAHTHDENGNPYNVKTVIDEQTGVESLVINENSPIRTYTTLRPSYINWKMLEVRNPKDMMTVEWGRETYSHYDYDSPNDYADTHYYEYTHELVSEDMISQKQATKLIDPATGEEFKKKVYAAAVAARKNLELYSYTGPVLDTTLTARNFFDWGYLTAAYTELPDDATEENFQSVYDSLSSSKKNAINTACKKQIFSEHHDVDFNLDFFIVYNDCYYLDSIHHNTLYTMWDGKKVYAHLYDMDISMGMNSTYVNSFPAVQSGVLTHSHLFTQYLWTYFKDEIKQRWQVLRNNKSVSVAAMQKLVWDLVKSVGEKNYERELQIWTQPSYRGPVYWRKPSGSLQYLLEEEDDPFYYWGYDESINSYSNMPAALKALYDEDPTSTEWNEDKTYYTSIPVGGTAADIYCTKTDGDTVTWYQCTVQNKGKDPESYYTPASPGGGVFDSPRRILEWYKKRLEYLDSENCFDYDEPEEASTAENITTNELDYIINNG